MIRKVFLCVQFLLFYSKVIIPGNKILSSTGKAFPSSANIRWLEPKFKSTDPSSNDFLVPDWNDSLMHHFVVDKGWSECGIRDADGSIADIGAVPFGNQISSRVRILPVNYITESTPEHIPFILESDSPLFNCRIEYSRLIDISISDTNAFGNTVKPHTLSNIHDVTTTDEISTGFNQISCQINNNNGSLKKGFFELVIGKYLGEKSG